MTKEIRSRVVDAQHSYNFHHPEEYKATAILKGAFQSEQEKILKDRQQFFPHALLVQNKVVIPRKIEISGVRSIQYDAVPDSMLVTQFEETVKDVITRLQLPIDTVTEANIYYDTTQNPILLLRLENNKEITALTITETERQDNSDRGQTPSSTIQVAGLRGSHSGHDLNVLSSEITLHRRSGLMYPPTIKPDVEKATGEKKGHLLGKVMSQNDEIVKQYLGSLWKPTWNYLDVASLTFHNSEDNNSPVIMSPNEHMFEGQLIDMFNQFVQGAVGVTDGS